MKRAIMMLLIMVSPLIYAGASYADWNQGGHPGFHANHSYFHYHDHPRYGLQVASFYPDEYYPVWVGGTQYYYDDGVYYNNAGGEYVVAAPPAGAVVSAIPSDFQAVVINGNTYYTDNGVYYLHTTNGYQVVSPLQVAPAASGTVVINVPRDKGGYVTVTLKKSANGFIGPQGEFYSTFPQVSQLKLMYGK